MYPYHNKIKQRIAAGELIGHEWRTDYPNIGECLVLKFSTPPFLRPIRPHRYAEYLPLMGEDHETPRRYNKNQVEKRQSA